MSTPYGSLSSRIPSSHRHKLDIESAILALLVAQPQRWECDVVLSAHAQVWLVGLRCPALGVDYGFRVPPQLQTPEHVVGWLRRFTDVTAAPRPEAPVREEYVEVPDPGRAWPTSVFPAYEERRSRGPLDRPYTGVERRRTRPAVDARALAAPER